MTGHVELTLLDGGSFMAESRKIHAGVDNYRYRLYNWAFLIRHRGTGDTILWDAGMSSVKDDYPPFVQNVIWDDSEMQGPTTSLQDQILYETGLGADAVKTVIFSHAHFDHCRPISEAFPSAQVLFGPGTGAACQPGHFKDPACQWDGRFFDLDQATEQWSELAGPWIQFAAFDKAMDYHGDGSFWIVQAPGHMAGNLCAIVRLNSGDYIVLGGDCCHSQELFRGIHDFAVFTLPNGATACLQEDIPAARKTLGRILAMERDHNAHIVFAHDASWIVEAHDEVLLSILPSSMKTTAAKYIKEGEPIQGLYGPTQP